MITYKLGTGFTIDESKLRPWLGEIYDSIGSWSNLQTEITLVPDGGPVTYGSGPFEIHINETGDYLPRYAHEFGHELGHAIEGNWGTNWIVETFNEALGCFALSALSSKPQYQALAKGFEDYIDWYKQAIRENQKELDLATYLTNKLPILEKSDYSSIASRQPQMAAAWELHEELRKEPGMISLIKTFPRNFSNTNQYFKDWLSAQGLTSAQKDFVAKVAHSWAVQI